uniref:Uncharacterized protein n=1 Tax=Molossus molossus TaxID=27622 RepID=A0A7J8FS33_MOLMO|nr:hypothetical protein HJG59_008440 [Molossus molossus]
MYLEMQVEEGNQTRCWGRSLMEQAPITPQLSGTAAPGSDCALVSLPRARWRPCQPGKLMSGLVQKLAEEAAAPPPRTSLRECGGTVRTPQSLPSTPVHHPYVAIPSEGPRAKAHWAAHLTFRSWGHTIAPGSFGEPSGGQTKVVSCGQTGH